MLHRFVRAARHSAVKALITLAVPAATLWAGANDVIFTMPVAGSVHHVGDTMRIEFHLADTSIVVCKDMMGFTSDDGFLWGYLPLFMNCTDTISAKKHYDWIIPEELDDSRSSRMIPTVGAACRMSIHDYEPITMRGQSATFTIEPRAAIKSSPRFRTSHATGRASLYLGTPQALRSKTGTSPVRILSLNGREVSSLDQKRHMGVLVLEHAPAR